MKQLFQRAIILLIQFIICIDLSAEKPPIKYGSVSEEELKMTVYEADTSASAVILCDYGYFNSTEFKFTHVTRIKVLKKEGCDLGNKVFPPFNNAYVRGITFNFENGEIVESKLKSESIFEEKVYGEKERIRISMPNVKVGSVIDIEFVYNWLPFVWKFQQDIPVKWSELRMESSPYVSFRKNFFGFEPLTVNDGDRWVGENMPAFKPEPYISSSENYLTKVEFDILEVRVQTYYEAFSTTWEDLSDFLYDSYYFGVPLRNDAYMNKAAKDILEKAKTDEDKLRMAHDYIKTFKWNDNESLFTSNSNVGFVFKDQSGNSADVNVALIQLLEKLGFKVSAVVLSTRENGFLSPVYPSLNKLNYVIARVDLNDKKYLIDGTEEYAPYYLLPERCLNLFGRVYNKEYSESIDLSTDRKDKELVYYMLNLQETLEFTGTMSFQRTDYAAFDFRNKYKSFAGKEAYLENMLKEYPGLRIKDAKIENVDSVYMAVKDNYEIELTNMVDEVDDDLFFYPMLIHRFVENPFKVDTRNYPIDFVHPIEKTFVVNITLPESLMVSDLPEGLSMKMPDNSAYFMCQVSNLGNSIQYTFKYGINKTVFPENQYQDLKEFFNQIIAKNAEPITLKRK